jgi:hypothetical protein
MSEPSCFSHKSYDFKSHWNKAYQNTPVKKLGWYEESPNPSLNLIEECNLSKEARIFNAGAGATTLIKVLLNTGYSSIIVNDIAEAALTELKNSLEKHNSSNIEFIADDLTAPKELKKLKNIDLWHDRAVLHFFTEEEQRKNYFNLIKSAVVIGGYVILAEFNLEGAKKCCGLDVYNYNEQMLQDGLGANFELIKAFNYTYTQPSGNTREYVYTLFKRVA